MSERIPVAIAWLRRDLRLDDHAALHAAAQRAERVVVAFVLDPELLRGPRVGAPIVQAFFGAAAALRDALRRRGSDLALLEGDFAENLIALARRTGARDVFYNRDVDPDAVQRDARVTAALQAEGIAAHASLDHVYFGADEVLQDGGKPYAVFTPYRRRWEARLERAPVPPFPSERALRGRLLAASEIGATREIPSPEAFGHASSASYPRVDEATAGALLRAFLAGPVDRYAEDRNVPSIEGTSRLSPHLRAGTIGIRTVVAAAVEARRTRRGHAATSAETWLSELIWRDFYQALLVHHPHVVREPYLEAALALRWRDDEKAFAAWTRGETGYPIVDAAMRQLNTTGWMHNRLRMIVASFLCKHLLIDYRHGERYFEQHLADADLAANNGGWQWSASTGTDAAPYFRVFNPIVQGRTYDPDATFVKAWIPELRALDARDAHAPWTAPPLVSAGGYPAPIVDHAEARARALDTFGAALSRRAVSRP